jgi:transcriptional regulator with XRE-family HTH domain
MKKKDLTITGMTQQQLADKLGVSQPLVHKWFSGKTVPRPVTIMKICKVTGLTPEEFILFIYGKNKNLGELQSGK